MSTAVLNWVLPTTRADGSPLAASEIASVDVFDMGSATPTVAIGNAAGAATSFSTDAPVGDHGYTVVVNDTGGRKSDPSNVAAAMVTAPPPPVAAPSPATGLTVTIT